MKKLLLVALATLALVGCQKQSQLDFSDVAGKARVQGYVYVDYGFRQDSNTFVVMNEPAKGCEVVVKVPYKKYDAEAAEGEKFFTAVCDDNGFYTIDIPVGQAAITGAKVYTRPFVGIYHDLVNNQIMEINASFPETSTSVEIENGKTFMASDMIVSKDVTVPNFSRQQIVNVSGQIAQYYEKKNWIDPENIDKGYTVSSDIQNANKPVQLQLTFYVPTSGEMLVYNVTTDETGVYSLTANLYDVWNINDVEVDIVAKSYLNEVTHYYKKYDEDEKKFLDKTQHVSGYYEGKRISDLLNDGDLLIGHVFPKMVLTFVPDYAKEIIYGIGNDAIDMKDGKVIYTSSNVLGWSY